GEQVASKDANPWVALVQADLEGLGYTVGAVPFAAAGVGAPNIRERLYWMADATSGGWGQERADDRGGTLGDQPQGRTAGHGSGGSDSGVADTTSERGRRRQQGERSEGTQEPRGSMPGSYWD